MPTLTAPDLSRIELPSLDDLPELDLSKIDLGKAVADAASAVGLVKKRRARWPFVLGAGMAIGLAGWAYMNADAIRERLGRAVTWAGDKVATIGTGKDDDEDAVAFTAAEPAPSAADYPNGFGAPAGMARATGDDILALDEVTVGA